MARFYKAFIFFLTLPLVLYPLSQEIKFEHISVEQGLSYSRVTCFLQDRKGFLWIGTQDGLNKYDGYKFTVYRHNPGDSTSISSHRIWSIFEDEAGLIWIGTLDGGLNRFDPDKQLFTRYMNNLNDPNSLSHNSVLTISEDKTGMLWIGTLRGGLNRFDKNAEKFTRYQHDPNNPNSLSNNYVLALCVDRSNILWIGTWGGGLSKFDQKKEQFIHYKHDPKNSNSLSSDVVWSILEDKVGILWIGTMSGGLNKFDRKKGNFTRYRHNPKDFNSISQNSINLVYEDLSGNLWIGTWGGGLDEFDRENEKFKNYKHNSDDPTSISHNEVKSIYEDKSGVIWIGTNGGGLNKLDLQKEQFTHFRHIPNSNSLSHNDVWSIYSDKTGTIWIGTIGGGLNEFNFEKQLFTHYKYNSAKSNSLSHNSVISIIEDSDGVLWIGTINGGLNKFNREKRQFTSYFFDPNNPNSLSHNFIPCIYEDRSGTLWIGTWGGGLCKYEKVTDDFKRYQHDPDNISSLSDNIIWAIYEDRSGDFWIGTETGGLNKFDREKGIFTHYRHEPDNPNSLSSNTVWSIYEDQSGTLWIGTAGAGLNKFDRKNEFFFTYTMEDGLPNDMIHGIIEDNNGNLWLSTNKGLSKFNPKTEEFRNYNANDGLQSNQFNFGAVYKRLNGEMLFGGINGFNVFHPDSIKDNPHIPQIVITDFQLFNKPVMVKKEDVGEMQNSYSLPKHISILKEIELSYRENVFSFEFAALDYHSPQKNKYAYLMEGVDPDWVNTDASRRFATYTNLDPGEYTFRVKGSNNDGLWNKKGTSITIIITPPWWRTNLAYSIYIFFLGFIVFGVWRFQTNRLKMKHELDLEHVHAEKLEEVDRMKSRFFANISHEFRTPLTLIKGPVEQIMDGEFTGNLKEQCKMILRNSNRLLGLINQILDLSKLESGEMKLQVSETQIIKYLKGMVFSFASLAERKNINLQFKETEKSIVGFIDRDKLEKIMTNLLSNAFKFTPEGGKIVVDVSILQPPLSPFSKGEINPSPLSRGDTGGCIQISITNTGAGISTDRLDKIFDRFYQTDDNYKKDSEGTGIGLALTKELVEAHHGSISVSSNLRKHPPQSPSWIKSGTGFDRGASYLTTFTILLPLGKEHLTEDEILDLPTVRAKYPADIPLSPPSKGETDLPHPASSIEHRVSSIQSPASGLQSPLVLIVEDNPDVISYISSFLENDYRILTAENGKEGLKKALAKYPDLIISDVMMPEMDGFELCKKVKSDQRTSHIPVILLTAKADLDSRIEGLEFGADDYISKPFEADELKVRSKNLIEQRRKLRKKFSKMADIKPGEIAATSMDKQFLQRLLAVFNKHISEPDFSSDDFAREVGMSRSSLHRKLQALTNHSTNEFIRTLRLKRAAQLLKIAVGSISEVAYSVGFNNQSYFAKIFRQQFGQSPGNFANHHKQNQNLSD